MWIRTTERELDTSVMTPIMQLQISVEKVVPANHGAKLAPVFTGIIKGARRIF